MSIVGWLPSALWACRATFVIDADGAVIQILTGLVTEEQIDAALDP